jgi:glutamine amidotransferase
VSAARGGAPVVVVDYGAGNLRSLGAALARAGAEVSVATGPAGLHDAPLVLLPGVGAAGAAMAALAERGLDDGLRSAVAGGAALFGICVGMQLLFERSAEGDVACLGLLPGTVTPLRGARRLPHMGWNDVEPLREHPLCAALPATCYFAHSYAAQDAPADVVVAQTRTEGGSFASIAARGRVAGAQFHPERSGAAGHALCEAVLAWGRDAA